MHAEKGIFVLHTIWPLFWAAPRSARVLSRVALEFRVKLHGMNRVPEF